MNLNENINEGQHINLPMFLVAFDGKKFIFEENYKNEFEREAILGRVRMHLQNSYQKGLDKLTSDYPPLKAVA